MEEWNMQYISCGKGHYYDPDMYKSCPQCAREGGSRSEFAMDDLGVTEPIRNTQGMSGMDSIGATMPLDGPAAAAAPVPGDFSGDPLATTYFQDPASNSAVDSYSPTMPVSPITDASGAQAGPMLPVVGWLVCVAGPAKGRDYRIHSQYNSIGRARHMDICIEGDNTISSERAALLAYDDIEKVFFFAPGQGRNIVRVNGKTVMNSTELHAFDELTIGSTKLLFVPLCGERFDWNDR